MPRKSQETREVKVKLPSNNSVLCCYRLIGTTPMLVHAFGQKSFQQMLEKMVGCRADGTPLDKDREPKDLEVEYQNAISRNQRGEHAIPIRWIKAGLLTAASAGNKQINGSALRRGVYVLGFTSPILHPNGSKFSDPQCKYDIVRVGSWSNRVPDVRARPKYDEWMVEIALRIFPDQIPVEHVAWALDAMGKLVGLGDYRVEKDGTYGMFEIEPVAESQFNRILKACNSPEVDLIVPDALKTALRDNGISMKAALEETKRAAGGKKSGRKKSNGAANDAQREEDPS
jgi:hypothetical protein